MSQDVPDVVVEAALSYTQATTLTEAILALLGAEIKRCADETCQKEFIFQEPVFPKLRSERKPRHNSQFCSNVCARRTTQRAYRRRQRAKAKELANR